MGMGTSAVRIEIKWERLETWIDLTRYRDIEEETSTSIII